MIDRDGKYDECDVLPSLLDETPETSIKGKLFVDIGANIGYCSLLMASVGAKVPVIRTTTFQSVLFPK